MKKIFKNSLIIIAIIVIFSCQKDTNSSDADYSPGTLIGNWKLIRYAEITYTDYIKTDSVSLTNFPGKGNQFNISNDSSFSYNYISSGQTLSGKCSVVDNMLLLKDANGNIIKSYFWHKAYKNRLKTRSLEGYSPSNPGNKMDVELEFQK